MRRKPNQNSNGLPGPEPAYGVGQTLVASALVGAMLLVAAVAIVYPVAVVGVAVGAVVARSVVRAAARVLRERRRTGRARRVCIPKTGVCVEA